MSKITLNNISSFQNDSTAVASYTANNATLTTAFDNTLSRDGTSPNQMGASLDMNGFRILNVSSPVSPTDVVRLQDLASITLATTTLIVPGTTVVGNIPVWGNTTGTNLSAGFSPSNVTDAWVFNPNGNGPTINTGTSTNSHGISITQTPSTFSATGQFQFNSIQISDSAAFTGASATGNGIGVFLNSGGNIQGARQAIVGTMNVTGTINVSSKDAFYVGGAFGAFANANTGGSDTGSNARGAFCGLNPSVGVATNVTNIKGIKCAEFDISSATGSTMGNRIGIDIVLTASLTGGATNDRALQFTCDGPSLAWSQGIVFDNTTGGASPIRSSGTFIATAGSHSATNGIDFSSATLSGSFIKGPSSNFTVAGSTGNVVTGSQIQIGGTTLSWPMLIVNGVGLAVKLADNSGFTSLLADTLRAVTSTQTPLIFGATAAGAQVLTLQTTTGVGAADNFVFKGGNNGANTFATLSAGALVLPANASTGVCVVDVQRTAGNLSGLRLLNNALNPYLAISSGGSGHYLIFNTPDGTQMFQGGDSTDPFIYFSNGTASTGTVTGGHKFYNLAINKQMAQIDGHGLTVIGNGVDTFGFINTAGDTRVTSDFSVASSTALTNVTGLSVSVEAGRVYGFEATLMCTDAAAGGVKAAISGTATATNIIYQGYIVDSAAIVANTQATALNTTIDSAITTGTTPLIKITGTITVNAAGTLLVQFAQNTSNVTASVVKQGSTFRVWNMT